ncbi:unnamed protein product [Bemisia tabaci]|uniref:Vacuolar protein-sorting-associated protein 36 n=1 Tax=Bemisia tabaci TaxID=7038 RepID=A0A9P0A4Z9_BEMTA|nr:PREDICTED: vacuolar protein-sorting-associated protein 36 [Bemisia tabaci]CAH0384681.1 unnamed protein product [Bemisia tabaci]
MDRFEFSSGRLQPEEYLVSKFSNVRLYDGDEKTSFEHGDVLFTNLRLIWCRNSNDFSIQPVLSLSYSLITYVLIDVHSRKLKKKLIINLSDTYKPSNPGPVLTSPFNYVKLSFKENVDENFVGNLDEVINEHHKNESSKSGNAPTRIKLRTGIVGIERSIHEKNKVTDESITVAFQDLSKLMTMAKDMVVISKTISDKICNHQGEISEDETVKFKSYLLSLGIEDPVTRNRVQNENQFYENLAKEISKILLGTIKEIGGMMVLTDAYCRVNRARGLELLSPDDFLNASKLMDQLSLPLKLRVFDSGVMVLQLLSHDDQILVRETVLLLRNHSSMSPQELSTLVKIPVSLAKERLIVAEKFGRACRDESIEGLRFHVNFFLENRS